MTPPGGSGRGSGAGPPGRDEAGRDEAASGGDGDPDLAAMRSGWLSMRDEEPPGRGMAELLAAARMKAEAMAPKASWWQRLSAALRRPPMLALATVLVLLGGAVLLGRRLGEDGEPARQAAPVHGAVQAPAPASLASGGPSRGSSAVGRSAVGGSVAGARAAGTSAGGGSGAGAGGAAADAEEIEQTLRAGAQRDDATREQAAVRPRSPVTQLPPTHAAPRREALPDPGLVSQLGSASDAARAQLHEQCEAAARRGDCPVVRRLVEQISQTDPGYRARVIQDAAFARCLE